MKLSELTQYNNIVIQCHDNPDADAIASGFGLWKYFKSCGKNVIFVYSGRFLIQKSNLSIMVDELSIPIQYAEDTGKAVMLLNEQSDKPVDEIGLLITADAQYGQGNLTALCAKSIATIDHHQVSDALPELNEVRSFQGSCSTIVWDLLVREGVDINSDEELATAFYYGLMTDTNNFAELHHPLDRDMLDSLKIRVSAITKFRNSNISRVELSIAGDALKHAVFLNEYRTAIVSAKPCDPNILGIIADMALEVDSIDTCLVYSILESGIKISARSCIREVKASEMAGYIVEGVGNGGGHVNKAGGFLQREMLEKKGVTYDTDSINKYLSDRLKSYLGDIEIIDFATYKVDVSHMKRYRKKNIRIGYVLAKDIAKVGENVMVRTLEGDVNITITEDMFIMIGIKGEIYPLRKAKFDLGYVKSDEPFTMPEAYKSLGGYKPVLRNSSDGRVIDFLPLAKTCVATGGSLVYAKELDHCVKLFTVWDYDNYYSGKPGDFFTVREDDRSDMYITERSIFFETYDCVE